MQKIISYSTAALFIGLLSLPLIDWIVPFRFSKEFNSEKENRLPASMPIFNVKKLDSFPQQTDAYVNDNIPFRENIIELNESFGLPLSTTSNAKGAFKGKDNFLFLNKYVDAFEHKKLLKQFELDSLKSIFSYRAQYLKEKGIDFYVAIVPTKGNIYPEKMPNNIYRRNLTSVADQFVSVLSNIKDIELIDLRKTLQENRKTTGIRSFHKTDQHWNDYGALIGYSEIINRISKKHSSVYPLNINDFRIDSALVKGKHCAKVLGLEDILKETALKISNPKHKGNRAYMSKMVNPHPINEKFPYKKQVYKRYVSKNPNGIKALWIRDSYAKSMKWIFNTDTSLNENILYWDNWCYRLNENVIEQEKPDIYILMLIEANIPYIIHKHPSER